MYREREIEDGRGEGGQTWRGGCAACGRTPSARAPARESERARARESERELERARESDTHTHTHQTRAVSYTHLRAHETEADL
eukprot:1242580-Rhodomonas_salina.2